MILVFDTSSLIKRYIEEAGSEAVNIAWIGATVLVASWIAEAEMRATFARKRREAVIPLPLIAVAEERFLSDWPGFVRVEASRVSPFLPDVHRAYNLRGADSLHLATALLMRGIMTSDRCAFATADERLMTAARGEGLHLVS